MQKINKFTYIMAALLAVVVFIISSLWGGGAAVVHAATSAIDTKTAYEQRNVLDDLTGSVVAGEKFSLSDYPFNENLTPQILQFIEFGYSARVSNQGDYGLYVYVYNPQGLAIDTNTSRSKIQIKIGTANYTPYELEFLNCSIARGYEGLFYKFKISVPDRALRQALKDLSQDKRIYEVSGITLSVKRELTEYTVAQVFTYSGFAMGYGVDTMTESTLTCSVDGLEKYVELDVHHTVYRPQGDYYEGKQSQLNSCYFRVPEKFFTDFGELSKIACEWEEYVTKPILVTQTDYLYQRLNNLHGANVSNFSPTMDFLIMSLSNTDTSWFGKSTHGLGWTSDVENYDDSYWAWVGFLNLIHVTDAVDPVSRFDNFAAVFYSGSDKSYKDRYVTSDELTEQLLYNSNFLGEPYLTERYSEQLFTEYVNPDHKRGFNSKTINKDDLFDVFWNVTTKNVWQTIFGGYDVETIYDSVKAIVTVTANDLKGTNEEISKRLYISENDVNSLKAEFNKCNNERLVLFRFGESDYYSIPCVEAYCSTSDSSDNNLVKACATAWNNGNYTAYIAQETVYLDFDIISLWFVSDRVETEIPVVSTPKDVISDIAPPPDEDYHNDGSKKIIAIILTVVLVVLIAVFVGMFWKYLFPPKVSVNINDTKANKRE